MNRAKETKIDEEYLAKELGGKRVKGSGCWPGRPQDVKFSGFLMQAKRTEKKSISVRDHDLRRVEEDAANSGRVPAFRIGFGKPGQTEDWIMFPSWWLKHQEWWRDQ